MRHPIAILLACTVAGLAAGQEAHTVRFKTKPSPGQGAVARTTSVDSGSTSLTNVETKKDTVIKPERDEGVSEMSVIAADKDGKPTVYAIQHEKSRKTENGKTKSDSYEGKTLYWEKQKSGKFRIGVDGPNTLSGEDVAKFYESVSKPGESEALLTAMTPAKKVRAGDSWPVDIAKLAQLSDLEIDPKASAGTAKLTKVETVGQSLIGTFEVDVKLSVKRMAGLKQLDFETPVEFGMSGTLRLAIDASTTESTTRMTMSMKGESLLGGNLKGVHMKSDVSGKIEATVSSESPAKIKAIPNTVTWIPAPGEWIDYAPKDKSFTVAIPGTPKLDAQKGSDTWTYASPDKASVYIVGRVEITAPNVTLKAVADNVASKYQGAKVAEFQWGDKGGYELKYLTKEKIETEHRLMMEGGVLWQTIVVFESNKLKAEDRKKFFDSFKLTPAK